MKKIYKFSFLRLIVLPAVFFSFLIPVYSQDHSIAKQWNEVMLNCIRKDAARPTVQARNLCHAAVTMYDAWALYDDDAQPFLIGNTWGDFTAPFTGIPVPDDVQAAREKAISYAMYRFLYNRYQSSPGWVAFSSGYVNGLMTQLGYDPSVTSTNYSDGDPAKLGNYIAQQVIAFGYTDGSNQIANYTNQFYQVVNGNIWPQLPGNPECYDPNRWQPLSLSLVLDQNGYPLPNGAPALSPEWGNVVPFALTDADRTVKFRNGNSWNIYHDPGPPPLLDTTTVHGLEDPYKFGFVMNIIWASHHTPDDGVMIDVSPNSQGNVQSYPQAQDFVDYQNFYDLYNGGDPGTGYAVNPKTGMPYEPQIVPRGDYTRVLSEFWADGPNSETPPGHWFTILNYVTDQEDFEPKWMGQGPDLDQLEFDVRAYFALGGAIHDAAISCWSAKGFYDYTRPIMAIRYMADRGQCSNPALPHYHPAGLPLIPGYIELVQEGDPLAGPNNENVNKIKIYSWLTPPADPVNTYSGVGWLLGENWWTFQRNTFVTPPFPGYYSGHSTYSRSAAEVMTLITGDPYFPGGMSEFHAPAGTYLGAEDGPSVDVTLQWATYRDASDQCSLSRIYGGLHPPQDDIPGRLVGMVVGPEAFNYAQQYINAGKPRIESITFSDDLISDEDAGNTLVVDFNFTESMNTGVAPAITLTADNPLGSSLTFISADWNTDTQFRALYSISDAGETFDNVVFKIENAVDLQDKPIFPALSDALHIDTKNPTVLSLATGATVINDAVTQSGSFTLNIVFDEAMNTSGIPVLNFPAQDPSGTMTFNAALSNWMTPTTYAAVFNVLDINEEVPAVDVQVVEAKDAANNLQTEDLVAAAFAIDTKNPTALVSTDDNLLGGNDVGTSALTYTLVFDEPMNTSIAPMIDFPDEDAFSAGISLNNSSSGWLNNLSYRAVFDLSDQEAELSSVDIAAFNAVDLAGNAQLENLDLDEFSIDTKNPVAPVAIANDELIADANAGAGEFGLMFVFQEAMNTSVIPQVVFSGDNPLAFSLVFNDALSGWQNNQSYLATYDVFDAGEEFSNILVAISGAKDLADNDQIDQPASEVFSIDTKNPELLILSANTYDITDENVGTGGFSFLAIFDEPMNPDGNPNVDFPDEDPTAYLSLNASLSGWLNNTTFQGVFDVAPITETILDIDLRIEGLYDMAGNTHAIGTNQDYFSILQTVGTGNIGQLDVVVSPNPVEKGKMALVQLTQDIHNVKMELFSVDGRMIAQHQTIGTSGTIAINTDELAIGMYFIKLYGENVNKTIKLSVQ